MKIGSWTKAEEKKLRALYPTRRNRGIGELFGRTDTAVKSRASLLGLIKNNKIPLTKKQLDVIRKMHPNHSAETVAKKIGRTAIVVYRYAKLLGVNKSPEYKAKLKAEACAKITASGMGTRFPKGHVPMNKGLRRPGWSVGRGRMQETQFKKGQRSGAAQAKYKPVGTVVMRDGYMMMKVKDEPESIAGKGALSTNWMFVHKMVWESANGTIPPGYRIWWKDGDHLNCSLDNLEIVSGRDHIMRTSIHTLPPELARTYQLIGALNRKLNNRKRKRRKDDRERGTQEQTVRPS